MLAIGALAMSGVQAAPAPAAEPAFFGRAQVGGVVGPMAFTSDGGAALLEYGQSYGYKIECSASTGSGLVTGATSVAKMVLRLTGCEIPAMAFTCENSEAKTIETKPLAGELGPIKATMPGLRLRPETGSYLAEFQCGGGGILVKATGSVIGALSGGSGSTIEEAKLPSSLKLTFAQYWRVQKYSHFLTGPSQQLTFVVTELSSEPPFGECICTHEVPAGLGTVLKLTTAPGGQLGVTR